jgi:SAM-dependent methyltransferase
MTERKVDKGDSERQAALRDELIKKAGAAENSPYVARVRDLLSPGMRVLDIGCGTAHIIQKLARSNGAVLFVGLDISGPMLTIAHENALGMNDLLLVEGNGLRLPFRDGAVDVVMTRLAEYSYEETYRVLKEGGHFVEYGLGPDADREIAEFFPGRIDEESFFFPRDPRRWGEEVSEVCRSFGFTEVTIEAHKETDYYRTEEEVMDLIEMVPLVTDFHREKDRRLITAIAEKYGGERGIGITWHYYILHARREGSFKESL